MLSADARATDWWFAILVVVAAFVIGGAVGAASVGDRVQQACDDEHKLPREACESAGGHWIQPTSAYRTWICAGVDYDR